MPKRIVGLGILGLDTDIARAQETIISLLAHHTGFVPVMASPPRKLSLSQTETTSLLQASHSNDRITREGIQYGLSKLLPDETGMELFSDILANPNERVLGIVTDLSTEKRIKLWLDRISNFQFLMTSNPPSYSRLGSFVIDLAAKSGKKIHNIDGDLSNLMFTERMYDILRSVTYPANSHT